MRRDEIWISIDPGSSNGWISVLDYRGRYLADYKLPNRKYTSDAKTKAGNYKTRTLTAPQQVRRLLRQIIGKRNLNDVTIGIEFPGPIGGKFGVVPTYGLSWSTAICVSQATALGCRVVLWPPKVWIHAMFPGRGQKHDKERAKQLACDLFPELADRIDTMNQDQAEGLADSLLIGTYTRRKFK